MQRKLITCINEGEIKPYQIMSITMSDKGDNYIAEKYKEGSLFGVCQESDKYILACVYEGDCYVEVDKRVGIGDILASYKCYLFNKYLYAKENGKTGERVPCYILIEDKL